MKPEGLTVLAVIFGAACAQAQDLADVISGFDDEAPEATAVEAGTAGELERNERFRFSGILSQRAVAAVAGPPPPHNGLNSLRTRLDLASDFDLSDDWRAHISGYAFYDPVFSLNGRDQYVKEFLANYESGIELGEAFVQGELTSALDLKIGRQVVVWGKSDAIRVTDVLNPLDFREPGLTEIRDLRLPVTMAKLDYYTGDWNFSAAAIPEVRFNKMPVFGSDYYGGAGPAPIDDFPGEGFGKTEYAFAANGAFSGWDLSLYAASIYNDQPHGVMTASGLRRRHARLSMAGISTNFSSGNWLWKAEAAYLEGLQFLGAPGQKFSRLDLLLGFDYAGIPDTNITLEVANRRILDFDPAIVGGPEDARENDPEAAIRVSRSFLNDTFELNALISIHGWQGEGGGFQRIEAIYDLNDSEKIKIGGVNYVSGGKAFFQGIGNRDRLYASVEYRF